MLSDAFVPWSRKQSRYSSWQQDVLWSVSLIFLVESRALQLKNCAFYCEDKDPLSEPERQFLFCLHFNSSALPDTLLLFIPFTIRVMDTTIYTAWMLTEGGQKLYVCTNTREMRVFTIANDKAKQQILTFKKVVPVTDWHFCMNDA